LKFIEKNIKILKVLFFSSCTKKKGKEIVFGGKYKIYFSNDEILYLEELKKRGELLVASRIREDSYEPQKDGTIKGFNYLLVKSMGDLFGFKIKVQVVSFNDYYKIDGKFPERVKIDKFFKYVPDLIKTVDVYVDTITVLEWRSKLFQQVKTVPTKIMLLTKKRNKIDNLRLLNGKSFAFRKNSSYEKQINDIEKIFKIKVKKIAYKSSLDSIKALKDGNVDAIFADANRAIKIVKKNKSLIISKGISSIQYLSWGVKKDNRLLISILTKYLDYAKNSGKMNEIWENSYGISLAEYYDIVRQ